MSVPTSLWAYWGPRDEGSATCANTIASFLEDLARIDPVFAVWTQKGYSRKGAMKEIRRDVGAIQHLLETAGLAAHEPPQPEAGFSFSAWTGHRTGHAATVSVYCGMHSRQPGVPPNRVNLELPYEDPEATRIVTTEPAEGIIGACVGAFDPDSAVMRRSPAVHVPYGSRRIAALGWLTYFRLPARRVAALLPGWEFQILGAGTLVIPPGGPAWDDSQQALLEQAARDLAKEGILL